jgi:hypothetical protein
LPLRVKPAALSRAVGLPAATPSRNRLTVAAREARVPPRLQSRCRSGHDSIRQSKVRRWPITDSCARRHPSNTFVRSGIPRAAMTEAGEIRRDRVHRWAH